MSTATTSTAAAAELPVAAGNTGASSSDCMPIPAGGRPSQRGGCLPKPHRCASSGQASSGDEQLGLVAEGLALLTAENKNRGGRPTVIDEHMKGKIVILLATGLSLRQTAAFLGITHPTISTTIAADAELAADIADARVRAELHPMAHLIREGGRSWKTAVWLLEYLERRNGREEREESRLHQPVQGTKSEAAAERSGPVSAPMSEMELARIAAIRDRRPQRKCGGK